MDRMSDINNNLFKILILGSVGVGKTSLLIRYVNDQFKEQGFITLGVDFKIKTINRTNEVIKLQIWDSAGQERYQAFSKLYFRGAHGILLCYDITDIESFTGINKYKHELQNIYNGYGQQVPPIILCGLKADLDDMRNVPSDQAIAYADAHGYIFCENSSRNNKEVNETFDILLEEMIKIKNIQQQSSFVQVDLQDSISNLNHVQKVEKKKECC